MRYRGFRVRLLFELLRAGISVPRVTLAVLTAGLGILATSPAVADFPQIVRVEEDWELVVQLPEVNTDAPQITCAISPGGDLYGVYASFELNHHTQPAYAAGGLQLQLWSGDSPVAFSAAPNQALLSQSSETIRWTQRMQLDDGHLTFDVVDGTSATWGSFGGGGNLAVTVPTTLNSLIGYRPSFSVDHSGVGYAGNRVASLVLREVRWYTASGLVARDSTDRTVHTQD